MKENEDFCRGNLHGGEAPPVACYFFFLIFFKVMVRWRGRGRGGEYALCDYD